MLQIISEGLIPTLFAGSAAFLPAFIAGYLLCALIAYALGSINFAIVISKKFYKDDIRKYGSGNAGMTNMMRTYGKGAAALTLLGDALKAAVSVLIGWLIMGMHFGGGYVGGLFAILGHIWPLYYRFKGGKGVITAAVSILMLNPTVFVILFVLFCIIVLVTRYISLGSVVCACIFPLLTYYGTMPESRGFAFCFSFLIALLIVVMHRENIQRLAHGEESKFTFHTKGEKKKYESKQYTVTKSRKKKK